MVWIFQEHAQGLAAAREQDAHLCDFTIICGDREWRVHKFVLGLHGGPLRAAIQGNWTEAHTNRLDLSADPVFAVDALVQSLYTFQYELADVEPTDVLTAHTQVCILADKYRLSGLHDLAAGKFEVDLRKVNLPNDDLASALTIACEALQPTTKIRNAALEYIVKSKDYLSGTKADGSTLAEVLFGNPTLACDLAQAAMHRNEIIGVVDAKRGEERFACDTCRQTFVLSTDLFIADDEDNEQRMRCPDACCDSSDRKLQYWHPVDSAELASFREQLGGLQRANSLTMAAVISLRMVIKKLANAQEDDTDLSDFTITCGNTEWRVHKLVLRLHEGALRAVTQGDWKETQNGRLDLSVDPVVAVDALVQYLYKLEYNLAEDHATLTSHTQVCIIADKYRMSDLKLAAEIKFRTAIETLGAPNDDLLEAIRSTWDAPGPTSAIRAAVLKFSVGRQDIFADDKEERSPFVALMAENVDFAIEVAQAASRQISRVVQGKYGEVRHKCVRCGGTFIADYEFYHQDENGIAWIRCPDARCSSSAMKAMDFKIVEHGER
ncbi:hypothetical protein CBER1_09270 [Cercospora berteroae]|uniref:BTB domain-containing protein n=1 Tax=Cercospora berteroae TaxID=357750 RepID=A0A2S6CGI1_9PEZI|nr:hypothetical protein CBER1_09270 [Cercospora berteroae]